VQRFETPKIERLGLNELWSSASSFLWQCVPCPAPADVEREMPPDDQLAEVLLQCVSARAGQPYEIADGHSSVLGGMFDDPQ
jgi:hypothetical protein